MTAKRRSFVREYLVDCNGTQAAIRAGYSKKTANEQAARLLANVSVKTAIDEALKKLAAKVEVTKEKVLRELALVGFANMADYIRHENGDVHVDLSKLTREQAAAIQEVTVDEHAEGGGNGARQAKRKKLKLSDKIRALELIGKHLKLFTDVVEHSGGIILKHSVPRPKHGEPGSTQ